MPNFQAMVLTGARVQLSGPTAKDTTIALGASGGTASFDGLEVGTYTVRVWGLVGDTVDSYGEATNVSVTEGQTKSVNMANPGSGTPWGSLRPALRAISPATTTAFAHSVHFGAVAAATGYTLQWSPSSNFSSGLQSKSLTDTITTIAVSDTGRYYVRARATVSVTTSPRWSDTTSVLVVSSSAGGGDPTSPDTLRAAFSAVDTTLQNLNLFAEKLEDWFSFNACREDTVLIETRASRLTPPSPLNTLLQLFQGDGTTLVSSNDNLASDTTDSRITNNALPVDGTFKIKVTGTGTGTSGHYELRLNLRAGPLNTGTGCVPPGPASVEVTPDTVLFTLLGDSARPVAVARDAINRPLTGIAFTWLSRNNSVVQVDGTGKLTAAGNGAAYVLAQTAGLADSVFVIVGQIPSLSQSTVTVSAASVAAASAVTLKLTVRDAGGTRLQGGGLTVAFAAAGGTSTGTIGTVTDSANGAYTATFTGQTTGTATTVSATIGGLPVTSTPPAVTVTPGPTKKLAFQVQPGGGTAGQNIEPTIQVIAQDTFNNAVPGVSGSVVMSIGANPSGGILFGTGTKSFVSGVASFTDLKIDKAGTGYTFKAKGSGAAAGLDSAFSTPFDINGGAAARVAFVVEPTNAGANGSITPSIQVAIQDNLGNAVTGATNQITLSFFANPGGSVLSGTVSQNAQGATGIATFADISLDKIASGYRLLAASTGLASDTSAQFSITAGAAARLAFTVEPTGAQAGASITPAIQVTAYDDADNVTLLSDTVTLAIANNAGGGTLSGTLKQVPVSGVAAFGNISINKLGTGYTLRAFSGSLEPDTSAAFNITAAGAHHLAFGVPPSVTASGDVITPNPTVEIRDVYDNYVAGATNTVTMAIDSNPAGGVLSGTTNQPASNGTSTFNDLRLNAAGIYRLGASSTDLQAARSDTFRVIASLAPSRSQSTAFASPTTDVRVRADTAAITVVVRDAGGNPIQARPVQVTSSGSDNFITHTAGSTSISDASGVATATITSRIAELKTLTILVDSAGTLIPLDDQPTVQFIADSSAIDSSASTALANPTTVFADGVQQSTITVTVLDTLGNLVSGRTVQLTSSGTGNLIQPGLTNPSGVTAGAISRTTVGSDTIRVKVNPGQADSMPLSQRPVVQFIADTISLDVDSAIVVLTYSGSTGGDTAIADGVDPVSIQVTVRDTLGLPIQGDSVSFSLTGGGNTITQPVTATDVNGQTVGSVRSTAAQIKTLTITVRQPNGSGGFNTRVMSAHPEIRFKADVAVGLAFRAQPGTSAAGSSISPSVEVAVVDANDNTVLDDTRPITVRLATHLGGDTVLYGDTVVSAVGGVATFSDLSIQRAATGFQLTAVETMLTSALSSLFTVTAATPAQIGFQVQPTTVAAGAAISPSVQVRVIDVYGNTATSATNAITLAFAAEPDTSALLSGTLTRSAVAGLGIATFDNLSINKVAAGYTLGATSSGLNGDTSGTFDVTPAGANRLRFTMQPTSDTAGSAISLIQVTVQDVFGNTVNSDTTVTIAIANDPSGGLAVLSGSTTPQAVAGIASFNNLNINRSGNGYSLRATATGLTQDFSTSFNIVAAPASQLAFTVQPTIATAGVAVSPAVRVTARDPYGNTAISYTDSVTVSLQDTATAGAALSGTKKVAAVAGVAIFSTLSVDKVGTGYTLRAESGALTPGTSNGFNITAAGAAQVAFVQQPGTIVAGAYVLPAVTVAIQDPFGNPLPGATNVVTLSILDNPGSGTLLGQSTRAAISGVATFDSISVDKAAAGYTLLAQATSLASDTSAGFTVSAGDPVAATGGISASPATGVIADGVQLSTITVVVRDQFGNPVPGQTVTLAASGSNNTITDPASPTDATGTTAGAIASTTAEPKTLSATVVGPAVLLDSTTTVTFIADSTNVSALTSSVAATPDTVEANGSSTATITVTVRDPSNNPIAGKTVLIEYTGNDSIVTQPAAVTDGAGVATGTIASTLAQTDTVKVTVDGKLFNQKPVVVFKPGPPTQLGFAVQPTTVSAGVAPITPAVEVAVQDAQGNTVDTATTAISLALTGGTAGANLTGTIPVSAVLGIATFADLRVDSAGTGYQLQATAGGLSAGLSDAFNVVPGPVFTISVTPSADTLWALGETQQLVAEGRDSVGNVVPDAVFTWSSGNEPVMTVDPSTGLVAAVARGLATITASAGGKNGTANLAVGVRLAGIGNAFGSAPSDIFASGDLPGTFTALTPGTFNVIATAADLRAQFDVLLFGYASDGSVNAAWAGRLQDYLGLGGGIVFEDPSNIGELSPVLTGAAHDTTSGIVNLAVPTLSAGIASDFAGSHITFSAWPDSLAHFLVQGDSALGLYGRIQNWCLVVTGPAQASDGVRGGTPTQHNQYSLLLNEVRFAADCPLNATPGPAETLRLLPRQLTFSNAAQGASLRAIVLDTLGTPIPGAPVTWSTLNDKVATVDGTGQVTSVGDGQVAISAQGSGEDHALVTVSVPASTGLNAWGTEVPQGALTFEYMMSAWADSLNDLFIVGSGGVTFRFNGSAWDTLSSGTANWLWSVWGSSGTDVYAVGDAGTLIHYQGGSSWTPITPPNPSAYFYDVWGSGPNDVFVVGNAGTIIHWDGVSWEPMVSNTGNSLWGVWGTSPSNVYAVGYGQTILHYDGVSWAPIAAPGGAPSSLQRVWGSGPDDIFVASCGEGSILHYTGTNWDVQPEPSGACFYDVVGTGPNEVFAVGSQTIIKYNGSAWSRMDHQAPGWVLALWGTASGEFRAGGQSGQVWHGIRGAVPASVQVNPSGATTASIGGTVNFNGRLFDAGGNVITPTGPFAWTSENPAVATVTPVTGVATAQTSGQAAIGATYDGITGYGVITVAASGSPAVNAFSNMIVPGAAQMWDVWASSSSNAVAVGDGGVIWRYDGTSWTADPQSGVVTTNWLLRVAGTSESDIHAVGASGTLLHYNGSVWTAETNPFGTGVTHYGVWAVTPTAAYAPASNGYVLKWDGSVWDTLPRASTNLLLAAWASAENNVWAVGQNGTIVRWDGSQWNTVTHSLGGTQFNSVWGTSSSNVYVVGGSSMVQCNQSSCATLAAPGLSFLWDVWGTSSSEVFVASASSNAVGRWNGVSWTTVFSNYGSSVRGVGGTSNGTVFAVGTNAAQPVLRGVRGAPVQTYAPPVTFTTTNTWSPNYLFGDRITVSDTLEMTSFGIVTGAVGSQVKVGLYRDVGGIPNTGALVVQASGSAAALGAIELTVPQTTLVPGDYWIMTVYDVATTVSASTTTATLYYWYTGVGGFVNPLPGSYPAGTAYSSNRLNYYVRGFGF